MNLYDELKNDNQIAKEEFLFDIAEEISAFMNSKNISKKELAKMVNISEKEITNILEGEMSISELFIISMALGHVPNIYWKKL